MAKPAAQTVGKPPVSQLSEYTQNAATTQSTFFDNKVVPSSAVNALWNAANPNAHA